MDDGNDRFVHLHTHSRMSVNDGLNSFSDIVAQVKANGQAAIAITDHYYMYDLPSFYYEAISNGIKPILGCELGIMPEGVSATLSKNDLEDSSTKTDQTVAYFHGVFLAKDYRGYQNLMRLATIGTNRDDGHFYKKPRVKRSDILKYHDGLIFCSACLAGEIPQLILAGKEREALRTAAWYKKVFRSDFYLEIQDHGISGQEIVNRTLIKWARKHKLNLVLTNDCHYTTKDMAKYHSLLLCANWGYDYYDKENSVNKKYFPTPEFYIKTGKEMAAIAKKWNAMDAWENTARIAEKCNVVIPKTTHYPVARLELADNPDDELRMLIESKKWDKYKQGDGCVLTPDGKEIAQSVFDERLERELSDIKLGQVADYFLNVCRAITSYCHENDIMIGAGRGSVAGSVVSYILDITDVEPITLNLTWERFWNPGRMKRDKEGNILEISLPDIDLDIPSDRREEVMDHCKEYFGHDCVASIITFGTYNGRNLVDAVSKSIGFVESYRNPNDGWDMINRIRGFVSTAGLSKSLENNEDFKDLYESDSKVRNLVDMCLPIEGCTKNVSSHAAGILIADSDMLQYTPTTIGKHGVTTQYPFETLEKLGCLKVDLLGHEAEVIIARACDYIYDNHGIEIVPREIPTDDEATFEMLQKCDTRGVPQIQEDWVLPIIHDVHPDKFSHVIDLITMIRPGSKDSGQTEKYRKIRRGEMKPHPDIPQVASITDETYGCWLYQEQVMDVVKKLGGFTLEQADDLRKVVAKTKYADKAEKLMSIFKDGCLNKSHLTVKEWQLLDDVIRKFFSYAFNKAHSAGYGTTSYRCAWLKANYFIEFMTSILNSCPKDKVGFYLDNIFEHGYDISVPDINVSGFYWTCENGVLRPPLTIIDKCGPTVVSAIVEERELRGEFKSFEDFLLRTQARSVKVNSVENMICCGCFQNMGYTIKTLWEAAEQDYIRSVRDGRTSLFGRKNKGLPKGGSEYDIYTIQDDEDYLMGIVITLTDEEKEKRREQIIRSVRKFRKTSEMSARPDVSERLRKRIEKRRSSDADSSSEKPVSGDSLELLKQKLRGKRKPVKKANDKPDSLPVSQDLIDAYVRVDSSDNTVPARIYAMLRKYVENPKYSLVIVTRTRSKDKFRLETSFAFNQDGYERLKKLFGDKVWLE